MAIFQVNLLPNTQFLQDFFLYQSTCSTGEPLWISSTCFYELDTLQVTQPAVSKH